MMWLVHHTTMRKHSQQQKQIGKHSPSSLLKSKQKIFLVPSNYQIDSCIIISFSITRVVRITNNTSNVSLEPAKLSSFAQRRLFRDLCMRGNTYIIIIFNITWSLSHPKLSVCISSSLQRALILVRMALFDAFHFPLLGYLCFNSSFILY